MRLRTLKTRVLMMFPKITVAARIDTKSTSCREMHTLRNEDEDSPDEHILLRPETELTQYICPCLLIRMRLKYYECQQVDLWSCS